MKSKVSLLFPISVFAVLIPCAEAAVLITQYYEGPSTNKWIEITNTGTVDVDLAASAYKLSLWANANTEAYKSNGSPSQTMSLTGTLPAGSSFLFGNTANTTPGYATATTSNNTVINFNGDDSVTLWTGTTFATVNLVDVVAFTDLGNEGADKSFVRLNVNQGWNTTLGSDILDFNSVWQSVTLATVDGAAVNTEARLGYSAVPEPAAALLGGIGLLGLLRRRRV